MGKSALFALKVRVFQTKMDPPFKELSFSEETHYAGFHDESKRITFDDGGGGGGGSGPK